MNGEWHFSLPAKLSTSNSSTLNYTFNTWPYVRVKNRPKEIELHEEKLEFLFFALFDTKNLSSLAFSSSFHKAQTVQQHPTAQWHL